MRRHRVLTVVTAGAVAALLCSAATGAQQSRDVSTKGLTSRRTTTVTYEARRSTKVDLVGTPLLPRARGEAEIETQAAGPIRIKAKVKDLSPPAQFGSEYLTYVFWAIPPKGRPKNLGELRPDDGKSEIEATADVQTFALIVTAEPYYAVTTPSEVVVMENLVRSGTRGSTSVAVLEYEIVPRGAYIAADAQYGIPPKSKKEPVDMQQARNALAIARLADAPRYSADLFGGAQKLMGQAEQLVVSKASKREIISQARATVQAAEESRLQAVAGARAEAERVARDDAAAREQAAADRERDARERAAQEAAARIAAEQEQRRAQEAAQLAAQEKQRAEEAAQQAALERQRADEARREAEALRAEAQAQAAAADALRAKAEQDRTDLRATLLRQFSDILDTRDTTRGLIVNVGDVLFESGRYELRPAAREKLARFGGIVLAHPGLTVQAEGFTDSTGTDAINDRLSQQRADSVREFLAAQGLARDRLSAKGYGSSNPVASNDTREGRQQNRRVELVVAGDVIGTPIGDAR